MVLTANVRAALRQLTAIKNQILALLEWEKLAVQEHRQAPYPRSDLHDTVLNNLRNEICDAHAQFVWHATQAEDVLRDPDLPCTREERESWQRRLSRLEDEVGQIVTGRFISY